tara:strand:+ start:25910 stop:26542 length:633 start_codon:yes stop_codon:yes gene_type:complete
MMMSGLALYSYFKASISHFKAPIKAAALGAVVLLLAACQAAPIQRDYDINRDFTQYRNWNWAEPDVSYTPENDPRIQSDLTTQRIREAVSGQLDVRGLRPAQPGQEADLDVKVYVISEMRKDNVTTSYGGSFGSYWGGWGGGWGGGPGYAETRTVDYQVFTLQIDLLDDGQLVWRGSDEQQLRTTAQSPAERSQQIQQMVTKILGGFPPY